MNNEIFLKAVAEDYLERKINVLVNIELIKTHCSWKTILIHF